MQRRLCARVQNIDEILAGRTQKRQLGSRAGNTFSTATFAAEEEAVRGPQWLCICC